MTWWMILLLIFGVLFLIGCIPVGVWLRYQDETLTLKAKIGFLKLQLLPKDEKQPKKAKKTKKPKKEKPQNKKLEAKSGKKQPLLPKGVGTIFDLLRLLGDTLGNLRRKIRIEELRLHLIFGGDDPADAAMSYGRGWAIIGAMNPYLERLFVIKKRDIQPFLDYNTDKMKIDAQLTLTITIWRVLALALRAGVGFLKIMNARKKGGAGNESSS